MFIDEIEPERRDEIIEWAAERITDWGMIAPAMLFIDGFRPLSFIASQAVHFFAPVANILTGHPYASELGFVMQDRSNLDRLLDRLEQMEEEDRDEVGGDDTDSGADDENDDEDEDKNENE